MARMKFLCDADRCIECNACVTACKNEHDVPWGINRRRVVTINDGKPGERSVSMACMHCTDAPCAAVCPVDCFYTTADAVVLHSKDLCIVAATASTLARSARHNIRASAISARAGRWTNAPSALAVRNPTTLRWNMSNTAPIAWRKASSRCVPRCARPNLLAGDGEIIATIYKERVKQRGYGSGACCWHAYRETITG